ISEIKYLAINLDLGTYYALFETQAKYEFTPYLKPIQPQLIIDVAKETTPKPKSIRKN
ncbi:14874_t:CDS:1, partial [Dentiscutata heterogama]